MNKRLVAIILAMVFATSMAFTSFAASSAKKTVSESAVAAVRPNVNKMNLSDITENLIDLGVYSESDGEEVIITLFSLNDGQYILFGVLDNATDASDLFVGKLNEKNTKVTGKSIAFKDVEDINDKTVKFSFTLKDDNIIFADGSKQKAEISKPVEMAAMIKEFEKYR